MIKTITTKFQSNGRKFLEGDKLIVEQLAIYHVYYENDTECLCVDKVDYSAKLVDKIVENSKDKI